ncbi:cyclopropane-fatty-acyl-phospholipid synthase family protein [Synechococcus sp. MIT S9504]|uniref:SAM-dependent methyltransferase n=1 Tax=Synechococcus sp. MIT S9504 TaxID=1801628 RepID=UPI0007BAF69F|nr:methyltransferase domain-containing protein [Synechococcus sp. MIT S9504]KZR85630.1 Dimethylglycine N-methyltransferase [Synechococcus sp. MIT S9504]
MTSAYSAAASTAADYYDSDDADRFYAGIWGGEDIHIGLYESPEEPIATASRRTVDALIALMGQPPASDTATTLQVVDFGSGYGGAARRLCDSPGIRVDAINISAVENNRHRLLNQEAGLSERITVHDASFEAVPLPDGCADVIWSQDAILHSGDRPRVMREAARLLKPGGVMVMTDPMAADGVNADSLTAILDRIHLADLGSPERYQHWASEAGLTRTAWHDRTPMLIEHYSRVRLELRRRRKDLECSITPGYLERMDTGLGHWVDGGQSGKLSWGLMRFSKPLN